MAEETIMVGANSQQAVDIPGRFFACLSCTSSFKIEIDHGGKRLCSSGVKFSFGAFKRIVFYETSGRDNTITFYAGDDQYDGTIPREGDAVPVVDADTFVGDLSGQYDVGALAPAAGLVDLPGTDANGKTRRRIYITNADGANNILVGCITHLGTIIVAKVFPKQTLPPLEGSGHFQIQGDGGNHLVAYVLDIFNS